MSGEIAVNDKGEAVRFNGQSWEPAPVAANDAGEKLVHDGQAWKPFPGSAVAPASGTPREAAMAPNPPPQPGLINKALGGIYDVNKFYLDAAKNAPASAGRFVNSLATAVAHPVDTASSLGAVARGVEAPQEMVQTTLPNGQTVYQPKPVPETPEQTTARTAPANAVGDFYAQRYGSIPKAVETFRTDPIGAAADISTVAMPGGGALARAPGVAGKVGEIVQATGRAVDPLSSAGMVAKGALKAAEPVISHEAGFASGAGAESVRQAARSGREGGEVGQTFRENLRGEVPITDVVDKAKAAVSQMREERSAAYKSGMGKVGQDNKPLDFAPIDEAVSKATSVGTFKGQSGAAPAITVEPKAAAVVNEIDGIVSAWRHLDPAEYHTPLGIDALKRTIGNIRDSTLPNTPERVAADRIYNAVRGELTKSAPAYTKTMEDYAKASNRLNDTTKTFSLGEKATGDTAARKLLSATRTNVQTNFGGRQKLINALADYQPTLPAAIAGQVLSSPLPMGIVSRGAVPLGMAYGALHNPLSAPLALTMSPRLVGEAAHAGGRVVGGLERGANALHLTPDTIRALEQAGYQSGNINSLVR